MLLLWSMSFVVAIFALVLAVVKCSWIFMLISTITCIPVAAYFWGANNAWQSIGFIPLFLLMLTMAFWFLEKKVIIWRDLK
ncbi:hypothetical protein I6G82_09525 [Lysinibacillus macroides]|uniref:Uncharacterized protein n=1 Tax=Lysinibacillus macroides TaxID=33935 RepID=A0A0M9DHE8_9BACI|nr:hypothetical protein [Lysinibacillus macroides]KOY80653.1 hypothetical protein ADM90_15755 [Lysinibacillus macroides]QPR69792.1 hypothetical protein I6G82_09525 [Lysinibacillus macroides]